MFAIRQIATESASAHRDIGVIAARAPSTEPRDP